MPTPRWGALTYYYRPQTKLREGYVFTGICDSVNRGGMRGCSRGGMPGFIRGGACVVLFGGACVVLFGGRAWFYSGGHVWFYSGGMRGFIWGACVVLFGGACVVLFGGHAWFYLGGMRGFIRGGVCGFIRGACVVLFGGCMVLFGGVRGFIWGGVCMAISGGGVHGFSSFFGYNEIRSMSGRYASYWNAFLFSIIFPENCMKMKKIGLRGVRGKRAPSQSCFFHTPLQIVDNITAVVLRKLTASRKMKVSSVV